MRFKFNHLIGILVISIISFGASSKDMKGALITQLMIDYENGDIVFVSAEGSISSPTECSTNTKWEFVLAQDSELKRTMTSFLLSAYMAEIPVRLIGTGVCGDVYSSIETLKRVELQ